MIWASNEFHCFFPIVILKLLNLFKRCYFANYLSILCLVIRQRNFLRAKFGGDEDEMHDDEDEDEEDYNNLTLGGKRFAHGAENRNFEVRICAMYMRKIFPIRDLYAID